MARRSTAVEPEGTQTMICGEAKLRRLCTLRMKCLIISSATSKSAMTPSRIGRIALMLPGVRPEHHLGFVADREDLLAALDAGDRDDRRLVQHDAATLDVNECVRGAKIDCHVGGEHTQQISKHNPVSVRRMENVATVRRDRRACLPHQADIAAGAVFARLVISLFKAWI